jgi:oligoendopeptidase F
MVTSLPARDEINPDYTWNAESVFPTPEDWESEVGAILASLPELKQFQGHLGDSASVLVDALETQEGLMVREQRAYMYAVFSYSVDTTNQESVAMTGKARSLHGQMAAAAAFINPELLAIGPEKLLEWSESEPRLAVYKHFFANLFRIQRHVRSSEVEEVLGLLADPFGGPSASSSMLINADLKAMPGHDSEGNPIDSSETSIIKVNAQEDRVARQTVWENYHAELFKFKNTLANNLITSIKQNVFMSRVRKHNSALEMMLHEHNIPTGVFHNLIEVFKRSFPVWQRYFRIRRVALGLDTLAPYDMWAPLTNNLIKIPFEQSVEWIAEGLLPMGK